MYGGWSIRLNTNGALCLYDWIITLYGWWDIRLNTNRALYYSDWSITLYEGGAFV